ncbi:tail fiber assembly protein [Photorhabdus luminescens]|uniref:Phage tail protein n=1 Tax=Photorhabdus luminescens subsp. mexicana TaxID=2100167 RepID=A0A4V2X7J3_PHOLU|nr:tail fiber assembly protein [Photorhabdus luminescens]TDB56175.1 phage tail protein [Photorhabdus luminescens subsp. mexicana]
MYYYSAKANAFYPIELKQNYIDSNSLPDDIIEVSNDIYQEYAASGAPEGKYRIAGKNSLPEWVDIPPPTQEELQLQAKNKKQQLIVNASKQIAPLQDAVDIGMATEAEKSALLEWKKYRVLLTRVDILQTPDIEWPEMPK